MAVCNLFMSGIVACGGAATAGVLPNQPRTNESNPLTRLRPGWVGFASSVVHTSTTSNIPSRHCSFPVRIRTFFFRVLGGLTSARHRKKVLLRMASGWSPPFRSWR